MTSDKISLKEYIRISRIMYTALIIGQLLFLAISVFLVSVNKFEFGRTGLDNVFIILVPIISVASCIGGFTLFKKKLEEIKSKTILFEKLAEYRSAQILRWVLIEGPSFFSITVFLITANYMFLAFAAVLICIFIYTIPTSEKFDKELELRWDEKNQMIE